jgi:hypothetical protein
LDVSEFLDKMKGVQDLNAFSSAEMRREWKQTSREGSESFRLLDEALGIHISRPLTRILTQEFPGFASALQSMLGAGVVGALGVAGFEAFEKISNGIENARKAEKDWADSSLSADETVGNVLGGLREKLAALQGQPAGVKFAIEGAEEAKHGIDEIGKALDKETVAAEKASALTTRFESAAGDFLAHEAEGWSEIADMFGGSAIAEAAGTKNLHDSLFDTQAVKNMKDALADMRTDLTLALDDDKDKGTHNALTMINRDVSAASAYLRDMQQAGDEAGASLAANSLKFFTDAGKTEGLTRQIAAAKTAADATERQLKAEEAMATLQKEIGGGLAKLQPQTDPDKKMQTEIAGLRIAAERDFRAIAESAASALDIHAATANLATYEARLDQVMAKTRQDAELAKDIAALPTTLPDGPPKSAATPISITTAPVEPTLGAGGLGGAQFDTFAKDQVAQLKMAAQAYEDAMGPQQKYELAERELKLLLDEKLISTNAYNAALSQRINLRSRSAKQGLEGDVDQLNPGGGRMQELQQRMEELQAMQSTGLGLDGAKLNVGDLAAVKLEMQAITAEQDQILLKTGGIDAGFKAWANDLQRVESEGQFVFQELTQATKGFEDDAAKSLIDMLDAERGGHEKMLKDLRKMWASYFDSLAEMAIKHQIAKLLAPLGNQFESLLGKGISVSGGTVDAGYGSAKQFAQGPGALFSSSALKATTAASGNTALTTAGTTLQSAATQLMAAAAALRASASTPSGGSGFGGIGGIGDTTDSGGIGGKAAGTDDFEGGSTWVGEQGPEIVNLPRHSQVIPNDVATDRGGGDTHNYYDQRGAVVTDDLVRKADAARMMAATRRQAVGEAVANINEIRRRTPQGR